MNSEEIKIMLERDQEFEKRMKFLRKFAKVLFKVVLVVLILGAVALFFAGIIMNDMFLYFLYGILGCLFLILVSYVAYVFVLVKLDHIEAAELTLKEIQDYKYKDIIAAFQKSQTKVEPTPAQPLSEKSEQKEEKTDENVSLDDVEGNPVDISSKESNDSKED